MKKLYAILIALVILTPAPILAAGISHYYIDAKVTESGDVHVKEVFVLTGSFNGFGRDINYRNATAPNFDGTIDSFRGSDIYNGSGINLISIKNIPLTNNISFELINSEGDSFSRVSDASVGDFGVYVERPTNVGFQYDIFNPSSGSGKAFYVEYVLKDMVVMHNDVAELAWNFFTELSESIDVFEARITLPKTSSPQDLLVWAHGPLYGEIDRFNNQQAVVKINNLDANTPIDVRMVFDKDTVSALKTSSVNALPLILKVEQELADEANAIREQTQRSQRIATSAIVVWIGGLIALIVYMYNKYDKERTSAFKLKYFREFPAPYGPEIVSYLFNRTVGTKELSASIANLIAKKVIAFEEPQKDSFMLKYVDKHISVSKGEEVLLNWLFNEIGKNDEVLFDDIKKSAKSSYDKFLKNYTKWQNKVMDEAIGYNFYEANTGPKALAALYALLGLMLLIYGSSVQLDYPLLVAAGVLSIGSFIYFIAFTKKTQKGNEDYTRWRGLKNFLNDFGKFDYKDLPQIVLWEKYLVYALTFGLATKLSKTMEIKFKELATNQAMPNTFDTYYMTRLIVLNNLIDRNMTSAVNTANHTRSIANSRSSSGSGFGGGFSSGGGSFGGGGGGGRF